MLEKVHESRRHQYKEKLWNEVLQWLTSPQYFVKDGIIGDPLKSVLEELNAIEQADVQLYLDKYEARMKSTKEMADKISAQEQDSIVKTVRTKLGL